jgi:hypothetical protein
MKFGRGKSDSTTPIELPGRSDPLILTVRSGEKIPARVLEQGANTLLIAITVPTKTLSQRELDGLVLEYHGDNGRVRLSGAARVEDPKEPDVLRIDAPRSVEVLQEREFVRIKSARPVLLYAGKDQEQFQSYTVDLSGGGFLLAGPDTLRLGEHLQFQLTITPGVLPITGTAKVVRTDPRGRRGVVFDEISDLDRRRLVRFIFECQRAELRLGLRDEGDHGG